MIAQDLPTDAPAPFRLVAFDLDGTLLEADGTLADASAAFLRELAASGTRLVAATGRRLHSALPHLRRAGLAGACVVHNGAMIADVASALPLELRAPPRAVVGEVIALMRAHGFAPVVFTDAPRGPREVLVERDAPDPTGWVAWYRGYATGHLSVVAPPLALGPERPLRVVTHGTPAALAELGAEVARRFGDELRAFVQEESVLDAWRLEVLARGADKWSGVLWVAERAGCPPAAIVAVGDDANDVEMLRGAGWSIAAPGASETALAAARERLEGDGPRAVVAALRRALAPAGRDFGRRDC